ncbi:MAG: IS5 family transposase [Planctomycetota bacterium]|nr:MAG: IS5 family transposase [Planctomycetota bacterium]
MAKTGRPHAIGEEHFEALRSVVSEHPEATMDELCGHFEQRTGIRVTSVTLRRALRRAGLRRVPAPKPPAAPGDEPPARYGYTDAHRPSQDPVRYPSSLTDAEWALAADLFELPEGSRGRPCKYDRRLMLDACCYVLRSGCSWRMLPKSFPPWTAVHKAFSRWAAQGKFEQLHDRLRQQWRERLERSGSPSAGVIDSQSTRISPQGGAQGFDAGKKVKGRKRHLVVDTLGLLLAVSVTAASVQDRDAAEPVVAQACEKHASIEKLYADSAYAGHCALRIEHSQNISVDIVRRPSRLGAWNDAQLSLWNEPTSAFTVLPKRWVVERTHAWIERWRRLVMHHDRSPNVATAWVWLAQARMLSRRLTATA